MDTFFKDKKIAAYVALKHHTRFIIPVMEKLRSYGAQVVYIVGAAERSQEITAVEGNLDYVHAYDYTGPEDQEDVNATYLRLRNGFVGAIKKDIAVGCAALLTVMDKNLHATAREYVGFRNFLEKEKPDLCFALHEVNRWGKMLAFWSKKKNIPFFTLQEGLANAANFIFIGHVQYSTMDLVWGEKTRKKLIGFEAPADKVTPVGNTHIATEVKALEEKNTRQRKRKQLGLKDRYAVLLLFSAQPSPMEEIAPLLDYFRSSPQLKLMVKFHPVTTQPVVENWSSLIPDPIRKELILIHGQESTYDLMAASDLCVLSEPSTTGLEALAIGKPLIQLKLKKPDQYPYDFVKSGVALHLTPMELKEALNAKADLDQRLPKDKRDQFIKEELTDTHGARDRIIAHMKDAITWNQDRALSQFTFKTPRSEDAPAWSFILPVSGDPQLFLNQLESIAGHSEGQGAYEVILLKPPVVSQGMETVLASLEGDVDILPLAEDTSSSQAFNLGAERATGQALVFMDEYMAPRPNWLLHMNQAMAAGKTPRIFGGMVLSPHNNILHAGMNVDANNTPVSAYVHLDEKFPQAQKARPFQMVDHVLGLDREFFAHLGGFHPMAGRFGFLDLCLRAQETDTPAPVFFIPEIRFTRLAAPKSLAETDQSLYFYARWHAALWENEARFYEKDKVTPLQLDAARMTRAMEIVNR